MKIRQLHLGVGRFHKAHQAAYNHALMKSGIADVPLCSTSLRTADAADHLKAQGYQYHLLIASKTGVRAELITSIKETLFPPRDEKRLMEIFASRELEIVSLTITEKGYLSTEKGSALSYLCAGLETRMRHGLAGLTILSCDNLSKNGDFLRNKIITAISGMPELKKWVETYCTFPNSMVDRIVPATTPDHHAMFEKLTGKRDPELVATEEFCQWIIEDKFAVSRPPWDKVGVQFVEDVVPYERMKLRLLNAAHSYLAYAGQLRGYKFVHEAIVDPELRAAVAELWKETYSAVPLAPAILDSYCASLLSRFENPHLMHSLKQIAMDGSQKIPIRVLESACESLRKNEPIASRLSVAAAWLAYIAHFTNKDLTHLEGQDPVYKSLDLASLAPVASPGSVLDRIVARTEVFNSAAGVLESLRNATS